MHLALPSRVGPLSRSPRASVGNPQVGAVPGRGPRARVRRLRRDAAASAVVPQQLHGLGAGARSLAIRCLRASAHADRPPSCPSLLRLRARRGRRAPASSTAVRRKTTGAGPLQAPTPVWPPGISGGAVHFCAAPSSAQPSSEQLSRASVRRADGSPVHWHTRHLWDPPVASVRSSAQIVCRGFPRHARRASARAVMRARRLAMSARRFDRLGSTKRWPPCPCDSQG